MIVLPRAKVTRQFSILITGAEGFIGSKLAHRLSKAGHSLVTPVLELRSEASVDEAFKNQPVDFVIHLAGLSHVPTCEKDPNLTMEINRDGSLRVIEAMKRHSPQAHFIFTSSAQVYAAPSEEEKIREITFDELRKIQPQNTYARSKWEAEQLLKQVTLQDPLRVTVLRLFNFTHRSQSTEFFLPHLLSVLSEGSDESEVSIPVGNLDLYRDIGAVTDLLSGMEKIIQAAPAGENFQVYNLCGGVRRHLGRLAEKLAELTGKKAKFVKDPSRVRFGEPVSICGSHRKLTESTGWTPSCITDEEFLRSFLAELP